MKGKAQTLYIEAEQFHGNTILNSGLIPFGYGLEHVEDINTGKRYTIIFIGDKRYSFEEREDGSLIY